MKKSDLRIVFMGTPDFAVESLRALVEGGYNIAGVVTMPDKPMGRHGSILQPSAVKQYAMSQGLPMLQPEKLKDEAFVSELRALNADLQIVVAFRMLPEIVWDMPRLGTFNLHASLLPQYRGAAPINWAIINGEKETGVTTFFLTHEIDTGKIILQEKIAVSDDDNAETVHDRLMETGARLVKQTIDMLQLGEVTSVEQSQFMLSGLLLKTAPKIFKETCEIDITQSVEQAHNFVRGLSPYPAAWIELQFPKQSEKLMLKVFETEKEFTTHDLPLGTIVTDEKKNAKIALRYGFLQLKSVQAPSKKRMDIGELLRGMKWK